MKVLKLFSARGCTLISRPIFTSFTANAPSKKRPKQRLLDAKSLADGDVSEILDSLDFPDVGKEVPEGLGEIPGTGLSHEQLDGENDSTGKKPVPAEVRCFDTARIYVKSGDGGNGCVAFRREKYVPRGGPSGADGGRGGHVWAIADSNLNSLLCFRRQIHWRAKKGTPGKGSNCTGSQGEDLYISVPPGTVIRMKDAAENSPPIAELTHPGMKAVLLPGGRGGRGNASFKSQKNTVPQLAENGEQGEEAWMDLELKLVADVGIIGVPNAGKSTLLSSISAAKPKIASYPFTTLVPNLGVCDLDYETTVLADVPGLLEGAADGIGLGHEFLRHCMRCKVLIHVIDGTSQDPIGDYEAIQLELKLFNPELSIKPQIVCYNKMDIPDAAAIWPEVKGCFQDQGVPPDSLFAISAVAGTNTAPAIRRARQFLKEIPDSEEWSSSQPPLNHQTVPKPKLLEDRADNYTIEVLTQYTPRIYIVHGKGLERFTQMTNWNYYESLRRFHRLLIATGVHDSLTEKGIKEGDDVVIGEMEFSWNDDNSEEELYSSWKKSRADEGRPRMGRRSWPHVGG